MGLAPKGLKQKLFLVPQIIGGLLVTQSNVKLMFIFTAVRSYNSFPVGKCIFKVKCKK